MKVEVAGFAAVSFRVVGCLLESFGLLVFGLGFSTLVRALPVVKGKTLKNERHDPEAVAAM